MRELTPRSFPALALIFIVVAYALILLVVPFVTMLQGALGDGLAPVLKTFGDPAVQHALLVTFILSTIAVSINGVFGLVTAWVLVRHRFVGRRFFDSLVDIPFVFATPIAGYAVIIMFGRGVVCANHYPDCVRVSSHFARQNFCFLTLCYPRDSACTRRINARI